MDNRIFNINGLGRPMLQAALELASHQESGCYGDGEQAWGEFKGTGLIKSWHKHPTKGLILFWTPTAAGSTAITPLPSPITPASAVGFVMDYLASDEAEVCLKAAIAADEEQTRWLGDHNDSEVDTKAGWQVYVEDWGHVAGSPYALCAIRKAYLWYGK